MGINYIAFCEVLVMNNRFLHYLANKELPKGLLPFSRTIKGQKVPLSCLSMGKAN